MQLRQDLAKGLTETFNYDGLNRLTSSQVTGQGAVTVGYDSFGNITTKSSQGAYSYANGAGPHAATTVGANTNTYDANGNYTGTTAGSTRTVTYNTFDKPLVMTSGSNSTTFTYGPDRDYYKRLDSDGTKTLYLLGVEKVYKPDGTRIDRRYLPGGAYQLKNYSSYTATTPTSTTVEYLLGDQQGSTDVIADASGNLKQAMSFDAWGMRRNPTTWVALTTAAGFDNSQTSHGYTGHEMVDNLDLIHMHGRIYDARWGRMLQADPYIVEAPSWMVGVQDLVSSQAQNRYAYVDNNPMMHVDPTGYEPCETADKCTAAQASAPSASKQADTAATKGVVGAGPVGNVSGASNAGGATSGNHVNGSTPLQINNVGFNADHTAATTPFTLAMGATTAEVTVTAWRITPFEEAQKAWKIFEWENAARALSILRNTTIFAGAAANAPAAAVAAVAATMSSSTAGPSDDETQHGDAEADSGGTDNSSAGGGGNDEDPGNKNNAKNKKVDAEKGQTFRGGKKSVRDNWYGQTNKNFQKWWHREGKEEFNMGRDIQNSQNAREAMQYWQDIGSPVPK